MVTIISGTNRPGSYTLKVAEYYQKMLSQKGLDANLLSLTQLPVSLLDNTMYGKRNPDFQTIQQIIIDTDKFLFVIPEYNGSFPGVLKLFVDTCAFPDSFYDKKAALVGVSAGKYGNVRGIDHFNGVCAYMHLHVMPLRIHIANIKQELNSNNDLFLPDTIKYTEEQIDKFIKY